jgi:hypothetical protein
MVIGTVMPVPSFCGDSARTAAVGERGEHQDAAVRDAPLSEHRSDQVKTSRFDLPIGEGAWPYFSDRSGKRGIRDPFAIRVVSMEGLGSPAVEADDSQSAIEAPMSGPHVQCRVRVHRLL